MWMGGQGADGDHRGLARLHLRYSSSATRPAEDSQTGIDDSGNENEAMPGILSGLSRFGMLRFQKKRKRGSCAAWL